jgi:hypothetical protein
VAVEAQSCNVAEAESVPIASGKGEFSTENRKHQPLEIARFLGAKMADVDLSAIGEMAGAFFSR